MIPAEWASGSEKYAYIGYMLSIQSLYVKLFL